MGKNPTEAKKNRDQRVDTIKNVLYVSSYLKKNGANGLRRQFRVTDVKDLAKPVTTK
jgi:hypothetical protein